jgi:hypothetical protein
MVNLPQATSSRQYKAPLFFYGGVPLVVTGLLWWSSPYEVSPLQGFAAFILAWIPWASYRKWNQGDRREILFFGLIAAMYWTAYALPLFWSHHAVSLSGGNHELSEGSLTNCLYLSVTGVLALLAGTKVAGRLRWSPSVSMDVSTSPVRWQYLRVTLVFSFLLRLFVPIDALGPEGRQILGNLETILPAVGFAILFRYFLRGKVSGLDRLLVLGYIAVALVLGISSGWLGSFVGLGVLCTAVYVYERHKLPLAAVVMFAFGILVFQPAKKLFRDRYWREQSQAGNMEKAAFWLKTSWQMWSGAVTDSSGRTAKDLAENTLNRFSLLQQTANVMEVTPGVVPYQYGQLYSYIAVTLIPRFVWPDKPSINDANRWYQVSYRLSSRNELRGVSIAVGTLAESYINFGWFGPLLVMFPLGFFLGYFERVFLRHTSGLLLNSLGAALLPGFLGIESQLGQYLGGLAQQIAIALLVLVPVLKFRDHNKFGGSAPSPNRWFPISTDSLARLRPRTVVKDR